MGGIHGGGAGSVGRTEGASGEAEGLGSSTSTALRAEYEYGGKSMWSGSWGHSPHRPGLDPTLPQTIGVGVGIGIGIELQPPSIPIPIPIPTPSDGSTVSPRRPGRCGVVRRSLGLLGEKIG